MTTAQPVLPLPRHLTTGHLKPGLKARQSSKLPAHLPLHRRLLFPYDGLDEPLPKIIEGQGKILDRLDERIYHLLALALRAYILSWYPRISPRDRTLLPNITTSIFLPILKPILTSIYQDPERLIELILLDIPTILGLHIQTYWESKRATDLGLSTSSSNPSNSGDRSNFEIGEAYHSRIPLLSVSHIQSIPNPPTDAYHTNQSKTNQTRYELSPLYLTSLSDAILRHQLPLEQYASPVQRLMVREVLGRAVLGGIGRRLSEGWFWWTIVLKIIGESKSVRIEGRSNIEKPSEKDTSEIDISKGRSSIESIVERSITLFLRIWSIILLLWKFGTSITALYSAAPKPKRKYHKCLQPSIHLLRQLFRVGDPEFDNWSGRLVFGLLEMILTICSPVIDRILPHLIRAHLLTPQASLKICDLIEKILFPLDGYPAPTPPDPDDDEIVEIRGRLERRLMEIVPGHVQKVLFVQDGYPARDDTNPTSHLLSPLDDSSCNAHLVGMLLDTIVASLIPELVVGHGLSVGEGEDDVED